MAFPVILFNSSTGSDSAASGAGPATALTGSAASTSADGLTVTLDGSPDLTGVATDGSAVIYLADATAGARNFGKITAADNTAKTVTVSDAFGLSLSGLSWAIGGKRATFADSNSTKLWSNNSAAGDAMPGWTIRTETNQTLTAAIELRRAGDGTSGLLILEGASTSPRPIVNQTTTSVNVINSHADNWKIRSLHLTHSGGTKGHGYNSTGSNGDGFFEDVVFGDATNQLSRAVNTGSGSPTFTLVNCLVQNTQSYGVNSRALLRLIGTKFQDCSQAALCGFDCILHMHFCAVARCTTGLTFSNSAVIRELVGSVFHGTTGDAIDTNGNANALGAALIYNNIFSSNGGYGIDAPANLATATYTNFIDYNAFHSNTSGHRNNLPAGANDVELTADPYVDAANDDFTLNSTAGGGAACVDAGFPQSFITV